MDTINSILENLEIDETAKQAIQQEFKQILATEEFEISSQYLNELNKADTLLKSVFNEIKGKYSELEGPLNELLSSLGRLQGISLLQKVKEADECPDKIKAIVNAVNEKIKIVNEVLKTNLAVDTAISAATPAAIAATTSAATAPATPAAPAADDTGADNQQPQQQQGGAAYKKYLKYKTKYINLKKSMKL